MRSRKLIAVALLASGCAAPPDTALEHRVAAIEHAVDQDSELGSLTRRVDHEMTQITDVRPLATTLDGASIGTLTRAVDAMEKRRAAHIDNLANAQTHAFKRRVVVQHELDDVSVSLDFEQGLFETTDRQLDCAINGQGFFHVKIKDSVGDGTAYTRSGNFFVNAQGELVLGQRDGPRLLPVLTLPTSTTDVNITEDGMVEAITAGSNTQIRVGQLELTRFINPQGLRAIDGNLYLETLASGTPIAGPPDSDGLGSIQQNSLEGSNVDVTRERLLLLRVERERALVDHLLGRAEASVPTSQPAKASSR